MEPLKQLLEVDPEKVIGLRVNVMRLRTIREAGRCAWASTRPAATSTSGRSRSEVLEANKLMDRQGWRSIDVSYMAIEEIAREVMSMRDLTGNIHW